MDPPWNMDSPWNNNPTFKWLASKAGQKAAQDVKDMA